MNNLDKLDRMIRQLWERIELQNTLDKLDQYIGHLWERVESRDTRAQNDLSKVDLLLLHLVMMLMTRELLRMLVLLLRLLASFRNINWLLSFTFKSWWGPYFFQKILAILVMWMHHLSLVHSCHDIIIPKDEPSETIVLHLSVTYDETFRQIAICNDDYKFVKFSHNILRC